MNFQMIHLDCVHLCVKITWKWRVNDKLNPKPLTAGRSCYVIPRHRQLRELVPFIFPFTPRILLRMQKHSHNNLPILNPMIHGRAPRSKNVLYYPTQR